MTTPFPNILILGGEHNWVDWLPDAIECHHRLETAQWRLRDLEELEA